MLAEAEFWVNQTIIAHFYIIINCYDSNNGSVIIYLYVVITPFLRINIPVITVVHHSYLYGNNGPLLPVITVIMDPLLQ